MLLIIEVVVTLHAQSRYSTNALDTAKKEKCNNNEKNTQ